MIPTSPHGVVDAATPKRPTTSRRRRRTRRGLALAAALGAAAVLTGCQVSNTPTGYETTESGTIVQANFVAACTGNLPSDNSTVPTLAPANQCECIFTVIRTQVPFDDEDRPRVEGYPADAPTFVQLETDLRTNPGDISKLPDNVQNAIRGCGAESSGPSAS